MKRFARRSSVNGRGINKGYIFNDGSYYCETESEAKTYVKSLGLNWKEEIKLFNSKQEWFYYTEWEEIDEEQYYDLEGNEYKKCFYCKKETLVHEDFYFCTKCLKHL